MTGSDTFGLVIFDMDGVLVDSENLSCRAFAQTMARHGADINESEVHQRFIGISNRDAICELLSNAIDECDLEQILIDVREDAMRSFEGNLQPIANAAMVIADLDVPVAVASSSSPERIRGSLSMTGLHDLLAPNLFSATMVERGKPAPDLFLLAANKLAVDPQRCLVVEDSSAGVRAGKAADMTVLGFTGGSHVTADHYHAKLIGAGADLVIGRLEKIHAVLATGPQSFEGRD